jgi:nicotianamine synthase
MSSSELLEGRKGTRIDSFGQEDCTTTSTQTLTPPRTPTATRISAHALFSEIQAINSALLTLSSLTPGERVDSLLTRLVHLCLEPHSADVTTHFFSMHGVADICASLRPLCATAEGELETHWARRIIREAHTTSM